MCIWYIYPQGVEHGLGFGSCGGPGAGPDEVAGIFKQLQKIASGTRDARSGGGEIGGGVQAWVAGMGLSLPHPPLAMAVIYSLLALTGLYFGLQCRLSREE